MEAADVLTVGGASAGVVFLGRYLWDALQKRATKLEDRAEAAAEKKLDVVLTKLTQMELELRTALEKISGHTSTLGEVRSRVEGMSSNHGSRISDVEKEAVALRTRVEMLERERRGRR